MEKEFVAGLLRMVNIRFTKLHSHMYHTIASELSEVNP